MTIEEKQLEFMIYCIESTAERLGRYGSDVYNKLKELGAINGYIRSYYDTLHTQGKSYIVDSILEYIYYRDPQWLKTASVMICQYPASVRSKAR